MKYEWQSVKTSIRFCNVSVCNTPLHCITMEGEGDERAWVTHPGLNLTPEGEWVQAPGFNPQHASLVTAQHEIDCLKAKADELERAMDECRRERDEARGLVDEANRKFHNLWVTSGADVTNALRLRLDTIEAWATQPCKNTELRLAQTHVLKLVRGES